MRRTLASSSTRTSWITSEPMGSPARGSKRPVYPLSQDFHDEEGLKDVSDTDDAVQLAILARDKDPVDAVLHQLLHHIAHLVGRLAGHHADVVLERVSGRFGLTEDLILMKVSTG